MKKTYLQKGFTLIELLVVIAIIGILSSVVLASLNSARTKGADAAIKSNINNARAQAELFYDTAGNYTNLCAVGATGINQFGVSARTTGGFTPALNIAAGTAGSWETTTCHSDAANWALEAPLKASIAATPSMYCVDSTGAAKVTAVALGVNDYTCN